MFLVRDIMYCKPGQARPMVQKFLALSKLGPQIGFGPMRVMTDVSAERYWTVVSEMEGDSLEKYAQEIGLDMGKFEAAYAAALPQVESDLHQGESAGVDSTPTLFFNDRKYEGPMHPKYLEMWIDEELTVNR